jgi:putative oxidoreductase
MRRLFFTFANGPPGIGLLLIRLLVGTTLIVHGVVVLREAPLLGRAALAAFVIVLGLQLIVGLWTPLAGALIAVTALWSVLTHPADRSYAVIVGVLGFALALLGPGAWSVDARLFGWKRLK